MKLTYYLLNKSVNDFTDALDPRKREGPAPYEEVVFAQQPPFPAKLYVQRNRQSQPKWWSFFEEYVALQDVVLQNQTNGAVLVLQASGRFFAISFGFGYHAINQNKIIYDFGLMCSLKATDPKQLRTLDARNIDVVTKQRRTYASRNTEVSEFGVDDTREIVHKVSGIPLDPNLGKALSGRDAVTLNSQVDFTSLAEKCEQLLDIYDSESHSPLVQIATRILPVRNHEVIEHLDQSLLAALKDQNGEKLTVSFDSLLWDRVESVRIYKGGSSNTEDDLQIEMVFNFFRDSLPDADVEDLKSVYVVGLDEEGAPVDRKRSIYSLLSHETTLENRHYVFSLGLWFVVAGDLLEEVNAYVRSIPLVEVDNFLPHLTAGEYEKAYNERASNETGYLLLDRDNFQAQGASTIEVCDLLSESMDFICVKKETQSATLSHLFSQGSVSAILLNDNQRYRDFITERLPAGWALPDLSTGAGKETVRFVYAIATERTGNLADILPFFSKVNLRTHALTIQRMSFRVAMYKIEVDPKVEQTTS